MTRRAWIQLIAVLGLGLVGALLGAGLAFADTPADAHTRCIEAARAAERRHNLAPYLLGAVSMVETGRWSQDYRATLAWPWTVMAEGKGRYMPTKEAAIREVRDLQRRGVQNIDVGCLQVNLFYHPDAFDNLEQAFDPVSNADYAAAFLRSLRDEAGTWEAAVANYHSRDDARGAGYKSKVFDIWYKQRAHLVASAQGTPVPRSAIALANERRLAELAEQRAKRVAEYRMAEAAREANRDFLTKQRAEQDARNREAFEKRKAEVLAEWQELKRKRAAGGNG